MKEKPVTPSSQETGAQNQEPQERTKMDPVVNFKVGKDEFQLIYDYRAATAIARETGIHPLLSGAFAVMSVPGAMESVLWCLLTQMGPKHTIPKYQRSIKLDEVKEWFDSFDEPIEQLSFVEYAMKSCLEAMQRSTPAPKEGEQSTDPPRTNPEK